MTTTLGARRNDTQAPADWLTGGAFAKLARLSTLATVMHLVLRKLPLSSMLSVRANSQAAHQGFTCVTCRNPTYKLMGCSMIGSTSLLVCVLEMLVCNQKIHGVSNMLLQLPRQVLAYVQC